MHRALFLLLLLFLALPGRAEILLKDSCPAGFAAEKGVCRLDSPYRHLPPSAAPGVGGLRNALPPVRDGFTAKQIDLGRYLFFDPLLSSTGAVSCAHCHQPEHGFSDPNPRSKGVLGSEVARHAPSLWNVGMLGRLFRDGRAASLEEQMQGPLYAATEMGNDRTALIERLNGNAAYRALFAAAFPEAPAGITPDRLYTALAAFESSLVSLNSRYDLYALGVADTLSKQEMDGLNLFRSFVARCAECHTPPLFTNQQIAVIGTPEPAGHPFDAGAEAVSHQPTQRGGFRVPSLRNIELTGPYEHSGVFPTLREAVSFYNEGRGHAVPPGETLTLHWHIWDPKLSSGEIDSLVAFLHSLTDVSMMPARPDRVPSGLPVGR